MSLAAVLKKNTKPVPKKRTEPLWKGPEVDGVTFSLLSRFLCCRERFRIKVIEGLEPTRTWNHRTGYGDMWHVCEKSHAEEEGDWELSIRIHRSTQMKLYPLAQEQINHWYEVCKIQFPLYVDYWSKHPDIRNRKPLLQEQVFDIPYELPSGRVVKLRGKWDSVDITHEGKGLRDNSGIWLMENKTKGDIKELQLQRQLTFDLQTMLYVVALTEDRNNGKWGAGVPFTGVRYNVVRRPLSGGKGAIKQHQPTKSNPDGESKAEFYNRLKGIIEETPETYFMRWNVPILPADIEKFRRECLDPILEQLCDWWEALVYEPVHPSNKAQYRGFELRGNPFQGGEDSDGNWHSPQHWRHPFGVYNTLDEGGSSDLDEYLATGSEIGLTRVNELFPELKE